nr:MAG TPA: hypothetical protein [Caudoviricetes sp.]DAK11838.1 MAG TPA: hypothetical protein [Caudoviricetes sp.]DAL00139.1 MAG TPA: hypothetical protein [Caudoviricetes sp.]DAN60434.1 MAG TPA: hypothetical protein [Caudoviricetes sp.]
MHQFLYPYYFAPFCSQYSKKGVNKKSERMRVDKYAY